MTPNSGSTGGLWARFRFSVVGSLLSSPPASGTLGHAIRSLAEKTWSHPLTGHDVRVAAGTIARWYYTALRQPDDPVGALRRAVRKDCGKISLAAALAERLILGSSVFKCKTGQKGPSDHWLSDGSARSTNRSPGTHDSGPGSSGSTGCRLTSARTPAW